MYFIRLTIISFVIASISASLPVSADSKKGGTSVQKPSGATADKNTEDTSKDTKGKRAPIIDFIQKPGATKPEILR